jgi:hypothetical protein
MSPGNAPRAKRKKPNKATRSATPLIAKSPACFTPIFRVKRRSAALTSRACRRSGAFPRIVERHCDVSSAIDGVKDTNPKDAIGVLKVALSYVSLPVILEVALGMMEGGFKYGRHNYREAGVRASVYVDATFRHLALFWEGEDYDPDIFAITADANGENGVQVSHITKAIASLTVLRDSMIRGNWVDDRPPAVAPGWLVKLSGDVKKLAKAYPNPVPPVTEIGLSAKKERVS